LGRWRKTALVPGGKVFLVLQPCPIFFCPFGLLFSLLVSPTSLNPVLLVPNHCAPEDNDGNNEDAPNPIDAKESGSEGLANPSKNGNGCGAEATFDFSSASFFGVEAFALRRRGAGFALFVKWFFDGLLCGVSCLLSMCFDHRTDDQSANDRKTSAKNCLNSRNLPRGGLPFASLLARRASAISLEYGETRQLDGTLDVLTRQVLATPTTPDDLAALCEAFTARAAVRTGSVATSGASSQTSVDTPKHAIPAPTVQRFPRRITVGMATYDDYDGVYFTVQSIGVNNPELNGALELVVIDNNPGGTYSDALSHLGKSIDGYRYVPCGQWTGTAIRNMVFEESSSPFVVCIDSHVLIVPSALSKLISIFESEPDNRDLAQGPLIYDDLHTKSTHMEPRWRAGIYGTRANDPRGDDPAAPCFDIPMQGLGLFAYRRATWPGFNPKFRGFGGEEGYIHEKIRRRCGRSLCLPFLRWMHRFDRPLDAPYVNRWEDRMRNYFIGFTELGLDTTEMEAHFAELLGAENSARIFNEIKMELRIR
jgi:Glycosyl transferase family 2